MKLKPINDITPKDRLIVIAQVHDDGESYVVLSLDIARYDPTVDDPTEIQVDFWRSRFGSRIKFVPNYWCDLPMVENPQPGNVLCAFINTI